MTDRILIAVIVWPFACAALYALRAAWRHTRKARP